MRINSIGPATEQRLQGVEQAHLQRQGVAAETQSMARPREAWVEPRVEAADVENAVSDLNAAFKYVNERLEFSVHEETNRIMVKVYDKDTDEVLREIPPEQILDMVAEMQKFVGLFVDKKV